MPALHGEQAPTVGENPAEDQLDVVVVVVHALGLEDLLHLADEVQLGVRPALLRRVAGDSEQLVRVQRPLVELHADLTPLAVQDVQSVRRGNVCRCSSPPSSVITTVTDVSLSSIDTTLRRLHQRRARGMR
jgi:hypothetical protein